MWASLHLGPSPRQDGRSTAAPLRFPSYRIVSYYYLRHTTKLILSALQKLTTEHTEYTERVRVMNKFFWLLGAWKKNVHNPIFNER